MKRQSKARAKQASQALPAPRGPSTEVVRLRAELAAARKRIDELEKMREDLINRIEWALDSLHNLLEKQD